VGNKSTCWRQRLERLAAGSIWISAHGLEHRLEAVESQRKRKRLVLIVLPLRANSTLCSLGLRVCQATCSGSATVTQGGSPLQFGSLSHTNWAPGERRRRRRRSKKERETRRDKRPRSKDIKPH